MMRGAPQLTGKSSSSISSSIVLNSLLDDVEDDESVGGLVSDSSSSIISSPKIWTVVRSFVAISSREPEGVGRVVGRAESLAAL